MCNNIADPACNSVQMQERLYVESPPVGTTRLSDWVRAFRLDIGSRYASELQRRLAR
jgi:hypothetical protein